ncbi:MAG: serine hydrolase [Gemmatimonadales bacterium]|nr:serine hydrolase [Gemmatimonadales bacterium]
MRLPVVLRLASLAPCAAAPLAAQGPNPAALWSVPLRWDGARLVAGTPVRLTAPALGPASQPSFSPDGRALLYSATRDTGADARSDIWRLELATGRESQVTNTPTEHENSPTVDAAGRYRAIRWNPATLFRAFGPWEYDADGAPARALLPGPDTTGYYLSLPNGDLLLTRPKRAGFTIARFDAARGTITDLATGVPALPAQPIPGTGAASFIRLDSLGGRHRLQRLDLASGTVTDLGPALRGRTAHAWVPGRGTVLMWRGGTLHARTVADTTWRAVATFDDPALLHGNAYAVSPAGDRLIVVAPTRPSLATALRDSLEAGRPATDVADLGARWRDAGLLAAWDVSAPALRALADERTTRGRPGDALPLRLLATALAPARPSPTRAWPRATYAEAGLDSVGLAALDEEVARGDFGQVDALLVIRRGAVVLDRRYRRDYARHYAAEAARPSPLNAGDPGGPYNYFNAWWHPWYRGGALHTLQSVTKTVTSIAIGAALARGDFPSLDTPVLQFFNTDSVANVDARKRRMTIRHLLTMTAGLDWNEGLSYDDPRNTGSGMEASADWVRYAIDRPMAREPGDTFVYNSGASQVLAHVFRRATGTDIETYAARHLFAAVGITDWFWKRTPGGIADTEGGLYLRPEDVARLWALYLAGGTWDGRTVVTPGYVAQSVTPQVTVAPNGTQYGFKWWLYPYAPGDARRLWAGNGFGGQFPIIFPDEELLVVVNAWNIPSAARGLGPGVLRERLLGAIVAR